MSLSISSASIKMASMFSAWHNITSGLYNPQDGLFGLDYWSLMRDSLLAESVYFHELTHITLFKTTEFGQSSELIYSVIDSMNHLTQEDRNRMKKSMSAAQLFVQEGTASLIQMLMIKSQKGKSFARDWARINMPEDYYKRFKELDFVLDLSLRYRDAFTMHIPHFAMHNHFKAQVVKLDLLRKPEAFVNFFSIPDNNPDVRYIKMVKKIFSTPGIVTKSYEELAQGAGIKPYPASNKEETAQFLNYVNELVGKSHRFKSNDIYDLPDDLSMVQSVSEQVVVANFNTGIAKNSIMLPKKDDLLNYQKEIEAILIMEVSHFEESVELGKILGRDFEYALLCYLKTGEKFIYADSSSSITELLNNELRDKSLLCKWGLFDPRLNHLKFLPGCRLANVIIYNTVQNLEPLIPDMTKEGKLEYIIARAMKDSPLHTLFIKDMEDNLHFLNNYGGKKVEEFINRNSQYLIKGKRDNFFINPKDYNNTLCVWNGFDWQIDWFESAKDDLLVFRK